MINFQSTFYLTDNAVEVWEEVMELYLEMHKVDFSHCQKGKNNI